MKYTESEMLDFAAYYSIRVIRTFNEDTPNIIDELENWKLKPE